MKNRLLNFRRPLGATIAEDAILAEHEAAHQRVLQEHGLRPTRPSVPRDLVLFTCEATQLGQIAAIASDLQRSGFDVSLRWIKDAKAEIIGIAIVQP
jgi:hypothetical protein